MTTFESAVCKAERNDDEIFRVISDLNNIDKFKNRIPDEISNLKYDTDSCQFSINPVGEMGIRIIEREPNKTVKFSAEKSMIGFNLWIQTKQVAPDDTRIKVTIKADLNPIIKPMVEGILSKAVNKLAEVLAALPYKSF
jgi:carbon monoxide dehydrogenase subunit G